MQYLIFYIHSIYLFICYFGLLLKQNEVSESVTSEKKTVKKKKISEGGDSTMTKTKKTKKTKKSEEKENHISVVSS